MEILKKRIELIIALQSLVNSLKIKKSLITCTAIQHLLEKLIKDDARCESLDSKRIPFIKRINCLIINIKIKM